MPVALPPPAVLLTDGWRRRLGLRPLTLHTSVLLPASRGRCRFVDRAAQLVTLGMESATEASDESGRPRPYLSGCSLPAWRAGRGLPVAAAAAAAAAGAEPLDAHPLLMCWLSLAFQPRITFPQRRHSFTPQPVTRNPRYTDACTPPYRPKPARLSHTAAWSNTARTLSGNDLHLAKCRFKLPCGGTVRPQWRHLPPAPPSNPSTFSN